MPCVQTAQADRRLQLSVRDHGPGVDEAQLSHLTEAFYRADAARQRSTGGVGLGLYLCRWWRESHGGTLRLRNAHPGLELGCACRCVSRMPWPEATLEAPQAHRGHAHLQMGGARHHQHGGVVGRAEFVRTIGGDQLAGPGQHLQAAELAHEAETQAARHHGLGDAHQSLLRRQGAGDAPQLRIDEGLVQYAGMAQEAQHVSIATSAAARSQVLAAFDQHGSAPILRVGEAAALDHAQARRMAGVDEQQLGHLQLSRQRRALSPPRAVAPHTISGLQGSCIECMSSSRSAAST